MVQPPAPWGAATPGYRGPTKTDGYAIAGFVLALVGALPLSIIFALVGRSRIRRSNGAKSGTGLVVASLVVCGLWLAAGGALVLFGDSLKDENTDAYPTGPEHEIALVIDRFEAAEPEETCAELVTPELRSLLDTYGGGCESAVDYDGVVVPDIDITSISVDGDVATVEALEVGEVITVRLVHDGTSWRIDDIAD